MLACSVGECRVSHREHAKQVSYGVRESTAPEADSSKAVRASRRKGIIMRGNAWLLNGYCHLVNKTFLFIQKYFEGIVPAGRPDQDIYWKTKALYEELEELWDNDKKEAAEALLEDYLEYATVYFEQGDPWKTREENRRACCNTILNSVQMIANLTIWLEAMEEYPACQVKEWLELKEEWQVQSVHSGYELPRTEELTLWNEKRAFRRA